MKWQDIKKGKKVEPEVSREESALTPIVDGVKNVLADKETMGLLGFFAQMKAWDFIWSKVVK